MVFRLRFHPAVRKDLRRLIPEARRFILDDMLPAIAQSPYDGESLHGPLKGFWKYRVGDYRIAYAIDPKRREVLVIEIGPRAGFYARLRRRTKK